MRAALVVQDRTVVLEQDLAEAVERAQRGAQVVRDRVGEGLELGVGGLELGGAHPDAPLQLGIEVRQLSLYPATLRDFHLVALIGESQVVCLALQVVAQAAQFQVRADAREQLLTRERLGDEVDGAELEALHSLLHFGDRAKKDDRDVVGFFP